MNDKRDFPARAQIESERKKYYYTSSLSQNPQELRRVELRRAKSVRFSSLEYQLRAEAVELFVKLVDEGKIPAGWRKNIPGFIHNCAKQVPYIKNWVWALHVMRNKKAPIYAPMRYFKYVLQDVKNFRFNHPTGLKHEVEAWLARTKGIAASRKYALTHGLRSKEQVLQWKTRLANEEAFAKEIMLTRRLFAIQTAVDVYHGKLSHST